MQCLRVFGYSSPACAYFALLVELLLCNIHTIFRHQMVRDIFVALGGQPTIQPANQLIGPISINDPARVHPTPSCSHSTCEYVASSCTQWTGIKKQQTQHIMNTCANIHTLITYTHTPTFITYRSADDVMTCACSINICSDDVSTCIS